MQEERQEVRTSAEYPGRKKCTVNWVVADTGAGAGRGNAMQQDSARCGYFLIRPT